MQIDAGSLGRAAYGGRRVSSQRLSIARLVDATVFAFSAKDLLSSVRRASPGIGAATVYRALAVMEAAGFVERVGSRDSAALYARCKHAGHHHHAVCTNCGAVADAPCPIDAEKPGLEGFAVSGHTLVIYGLCRGCQC